MALAVASSTARVTTTTATATTAAFSPPAGSVLVAITNANSPGPSSGNVTCAVTNNSTALTWTAAAIANRTAVSQSGGTFIHVAVVPTARTGLTVTATTTGNNTGSDTRTSLRVWVVTGANTADPIGDSKVGGSTTNTLTVPTAPTFFVTQGSGSLGFAGATDWNAPSGSITSSDLTGDGFSALNVLNGYSGYKQLGNAGTNATFNFDAPGTAASAWTWAAVEIQGLNDPPTVNAGEDVSVDQYDTATTTATEDDHGSAITSRAWTVQSGPNQVGATLSTTASLSWNPTVGGTYVLRYTATNAAGSAFDEISVFVQALNFPITARLTLGGSAAGTKKVSVSETAALHLSANRIGVKRMSLAPTANLKLHASIIGRRINVVTAVLKLHAAAINTGRPGAGSVNATLRLGAAATNTSRVTTGVQVAANITLDAQSEVEPHRFGSTDALIHLAATRTGTKRVPGSVDAHIKLAATPGVVFRTVTGFATANIELHAAGINPSRVTFSVPVLANLLLHAIPETSSVRFNQDVSGNIVLDAQAFGQRIISEITKAILPRADNTTQYDLVCVARIPQTNGPPILIEVDPIDWTQITHTDELNITPSLSVSAKLSNLTDPVLQRVRNMSELPTELWLYRNGRQVFAGPLLGWNVSEESLSLEAQGLQTYFSMMYVNEDLTFKDKDQVEIVAGLIDQWQQLDYGNFGIDTSDMQASGVLRTITYKRNELHNVAQRISDLTKMANGFDISVDPAKRRLELHYPLRGVDRSLGEDSVVFDSVNVTSTNIVCSASPGDVASDGLGTGTAAGSDVPLISEKENLELRARYGRTGITGTFDNVTDQASLDSYVQAMIDARGQTLMVPGPNARVTVDSDVSRYDVGDTVDYQLHSQLAVAGAFRIRKRIISVAETGTESVSLEFV